MARIIVLADNHTDPVEGALLDERLPAHHIDDLEAAVPLLTRLADAVIDADARVVHLPRLTGCPATRTEASLLMRDLV